MKLKSFLIIIFTSVATILAAQNTYQYTVDLTRVVDDKVFVELTSPKITTPEVTFYMPKIIPGTYAIADYGRFVSELKAFDKKGKPLGVTRIDDNSWKINNAKSLVKISYWIEDTFDTEQDGPEVFWPAGTNIEEGVNYVINSSGFFGYFDGMKTLPFELNIVRPTGFIGTTGLIPTESNLTLASAKLEKKSTDDKKRVDRFKTENYDELVDSPLMYNKTDTAVIHVANTEVLIGVYSPTGKITAKQISESIREVLMAQKDFLGGKLPVDKYAFIFYFTTQPIMSYGALEHSYSSFYFMPEMGIEDMNQQLRDFAAHEFFHIVTPLTIHSKEIGDFDFNDPKMSQHLWMYEGVTEYFAGIVQIKYDLISPEQYLYMLTEKMMTADQFADDLPFTELSKYTLDKYHDDYYNVYMKGALIGLCLDIKLMELSKGEYKLQNLMHDLSLKFGKDKSFNDDELFDIITEMTYPEIGDFFSRYVKGTESLPIQELLHKVGVDYAKEQRFKDFTLGIGNENIGVTQIEGIQKLQIANDQLDSFGQLLGFQKGDVLIKMNGETIPDLGPDLGNFIGRQRSLLEEGKPFSYTVLRAKEGGELEEVELSAPAQQVELSRRHVLGFIDDLTEEQKILQIAWLRP